MIEPKYLKNLTFVFFSLHILLKLRLAIKATNNEHDYVEFMVSSTAPYCGCYRRILSLIQQHFVLSNSLHQTLSDQMKEK